ncbi:MAG: alternative ribosome rescue aminoacyl-tRNA hydrolase ArfB [Actinomycetes bacterium]
MSDLVIPPGPGIPHGVRIPDHELTERFARASGPGGQGVNTTDSRVQLGFDVAASAALDEAQRARVIRRLGRRLAGTTVSVDASEHRSQRLNRVAARERMAALLRDALTPPPPARRATRPTRGSVERRLTSKRRRAETKAGRRRPAD